SPLAADTKHDGVGGLEMIRVLTDAGLSIEDACTLVDRGVTAEQATDMLSLALVEPNIRSHGQSLLAVRILCEARAAGGIAPSRVREIFDAHRNMVVVRPDGVL